MNIPGMTTFGNTRGKIFKSISFLF